MTTLLQALVIAILAIVGLRMPKGQTRSRLFSALKAWFTVLCFWALLTHPIEIEPGKKVMALRLIGDQLSQIDAGTFWFFVSLATGIKVIGMLSSMVRWQLMLRGQSIELPFKHIFGSFLIGRAIGTFLPSTAGLDGYTLFDASRFSGKTVEVAAAKFVEKVCGFSGVFMTFLVALPFGIGIFGENATMFALLSIPIAAGVIGSLVVVLLFPGFIQWILENVPIPAKQRIAGIVTRISTSAAAYRDKPGLIAQVLFLSFLVHFTTAVMYYYTALAIGADGADFWKVTFGSSIQIFITVISPFTIAGEGIREAAQYVLLGELIGPAAAIVSAALGFWAAEAPTMLGFVFWWMRSDDYTPAYARVNGVQVDFEEAARSAVSLAEDTDTVADGEEAAVPLGERLWRAPSAGAFAGIAAGIAIGLGEAILIYRSGLGTESQVFWYGPLAWATILGGLGTLGGLFLAILPMDRHEIGSWVTRLGLGACLVPFGLFVVLFRLRRDVYLEQMPPLAVIAVVLFAATILLFMILVPLRKLLDPIATKLTTPLAPIALLIAGLALGGILSLVFSPSTAATASSKGIPEGLQSKPNIILVMVDTLRADHLSCYGAELQTPNLCRLAENGTSYKAFSHASWTKPAAASLLTSTLPSTHNAIAKPSTLSRDLTLISESMQDAGYTTGGIVSNVNLAESFGFAQGYDDYYYLGPDYIAYAEESSSKLIIYQLVRQLWLGLAGGEEVRFNDFYQDSQVVNATAFDWLDRRKDERFFLFLHYMDPHDPYFEHPYNGVGIARVSMPEPDAKASKRLQELYRGEIEYLDVQFGKLLAKLEADGLYDDSVIVLTADHGEEFNEHGGFWHGLTLFDEQIHVPLLIKWAKNGERADAGAESGIARLIDVGPTLLGLAGVDVPESMQGIDLRMPFMARPEKDRHVFSEEDHEGNILWSLRTEDEKLIVANAGNPRGLPERSYFDVSVDPGEMDPYEHPEAEQRLEELAALTRMAAEGKSVESQDVEMTLTDCERLRVLGYVEDCSHLR